MQFLPHGIHTALLLLKTTRLITVKNIIVVCYEGYMQQDIHCVKWHCNAQVGGV